MYKLNFLACSIGKIYDDMLVPFLFFSLLNNKDSHVELVVVNKDKFLNTYKDELDKVNSIVGNNYIIRNYQNLFNKNIFNTYRFFEIPIIKAEYTYIIDIDIMLMEPILQKYLDNWPPNLIYSNILREKSNLLRLTGVHLAITEKFYTSQYLETINKHYYKNKNLNDEIILANMCSEVHSLPDKSFKFRPILGIHFSPNRGPNKSMNLITSINYFNKFNDIVNQYPELFEFKIFKYLNDLLHNKFSFQS